MMMSGLIEATRQMPQDMGNTEMAIVLTVMLLTGVLLGYSIYAIFHTCKPPKGGGGGGNGRGFGFDPFDPPPPKGGIYGVEDKVDEPLYVPPGWTKEEVEHDIKMVQMFWPHYVPRTFLA